MTSSPDFHCVSITDNDLTITDNLHDHMFIVFVVNY